MTNPIESQATHEDTVLSGEELERDIFECANQLEGYVGPDTEENLAAFLLREGKAAAALANEIVRLRDALRHSRASGVKAVSLDWAKHPNADLWRAMSLIGEYSVSAIVGCHWRFAPYDGGAWVEGEAATEAEAKSAAQSHFNASIQSCLAEGVEPLRAALERIKAIKYPPNDTHYALKATIDYARDQAREALSQAQGEAK